MAHGFNSPQNLCYTYIAYITCLYHYVSKGFPTFPKYFVSEIDLELVLFPFLILQNVDGMFSFHGFHWNIAHRVLKIKYSDIFLYNLQ